MFEANAYLNIILTISFLCSAPFLWRVCCVVGKLFIVIFFPPKFVTIEIEKDNGEIVNEVIDLNDGEALVEALLRSTGKPLK